MYYSSKELFCRINDDQLPILDLYYNLSLDWCYEYRYSLKGYTGKRYKYHYVQVIIFRKAYIWSAEYNQETICPIEAKLLANKQKKKRNNNV